MGELDALGGRTLLVTGAAGMLGRAFVEAAQIVSPHVRILARSHRELDVTDRAAVLALASERPAVIAHCAADVDADRCEGDEPGCRRVQVGGTENVVALAKETGARLIYPQSFLIFGDVGATIDESTPPAPLSVYGRCKLEAEQAILASGIDAIVIRMAGFFGGEAVDKNFVGKFVRHVVKIVGEGTTAMDVGDRVWQPTYTLDLARNALLLAAHEKRGIYAMACHGKASFHELAVACVAELGVAERLAIRKVDASIMGGREKARRPLEAIMDNKRLAAEGLDRQRPWREALHEYLARPYFTDLAAPLHAHGASS